jgi:L-ascorbate metabolism protein UlaG (beta-lactamase superfamily)
MNLLSKIEQQDIKQGNIVVYFLGQSGYVLKTKETIIYIDPYLSDYVEHPEGLNDQLMHRNYPPPFLPQEIQKLDAVLCTHVHVDHMDPWTLERIKVPFKFYASIGAYEKNQFAFPEERIVFLEPLNEYKIEDIKLQPIPAAHYELVDDQGRPDALSFIININEKSLLFWGDGVIYDGLVDKLQKYDFEFAFIPINGRDKEREAKGIIGNINAVEVAKLCSKLNIDVLIPNHVDMFKNNSASIEYFLQCINEHCPGQQVKVMHCGDRIEA